MKKAMSQTWIKHKSSLKRDQPLLWTDMLYRTYIRRSYDIMDVI